MQEVIPAHQQQLFPTVLARGGLYFVAGVLFGATAVSLPIRLLSKPFLSARPILWPNGGAEPFG